MKNDTQMSREDMINHINELEARLKSQDKLGQDEPTLKRFNSHDDFISYLVEQGLLDIPDAEECCQQDEECYGCNQDSCESDIYEQLVMAKELRKESRIALLNSLKLFNKKNIKDGMVRVSELPSLLHMASNMAQEKF